MVTTERVLSLNDIIKYEVPLLPANFRHPHLKRKPKIGLIGEPGGGKSLSMGFLALKLCLLWGEPVWSNLPIKYTYEVPAEVANKYGLGAGKAVFASKEIDPIRLLKMDEEYQGGFICLDEINVRLADALKSTSNINFFFNQMDQQMRKTQSGLLFSCIDEMWVDPRLRDLTDIFIRCEDEALSFEGLASHKTEGIDIKWVIYPMTRMYDGFTFWQTHQTDTFYFKARPYWGIINTSYTQATGEKYAIDIFADEKQNNRYLVMSKIKALQQEGIITMPSDDLFDYIKEEVDLNIPQIRGVLRELGLRRGGTLTHPGDYIIPTFNLDRKARNRKTYVAE